MYKCKVTTASTGYKPEFTISSVIGSMLSMIAPTIDDMESRTNNTN